MQPPDPVFWLAFEIENELVSVASTDLEVNEADDPDVQFLAGVARGFHEANVDRRIIFISDLSRWLASVGSDLSLLDVDLAYVVWKLEGLQSGLRSATPTAVRCPIDAYRGGDVP